MHTLLNWACREADGQAALHQENIDARAVEARAPDRIRHGRKQEPAETNTTDTDSRIMKSSNGWARGYNSCA